MSVEAKLIDYIQNHLAPGALPDLAVDSDLVEEGDWSAMAEKSISTPFWRRPLPRISGRWDTIQFAHWCRTRTSCVP